MFQTSKRRIGQRLPSRVAVTTVALASVLLSGGTPALSAGPSPDLPLESDERIGVTPTEVVIASCMPLTSQFPVTSARAKRVLAGAQTYFTYVNDNGGVNGRKIKFVGCDDNYDAEKAIECFNSCIKSRAFAGAIFLGNVVISKYVRAAEASHTPVLGFTTGAPELYSLTHRKFVLRPSSTEELQHYVDRLWTLGIRKYALLFQNDALGIAIRQGATEALSKHGAKPTAEVSVARNAADVEDAVKQLHSSEPEAVILGVSVGHAQNVVKKIHERNWKVMVTPMSFHADPLMGLGKPAEGLIVPEVLPPLEEKDKSFAMHKQLLKKYAHMDPNHGTYEGYINAMVLVEGLKRAGKDLTREKFIKALETMHDTDLGFGPNYKLNFSSSNHVGWTGKAVRFAMIKDGKTTQMTDAEWKKLEKPAM